MLQNDLSRIEKDEPGKADDDVLRRLEALELTYRAREAEDFLERVEEVHETVRGLIDGSIDAAELERQEERETLRERAKQMKKEEEAARAQEALLMGREGKGESKTRPYTFFCRACLVEFTLPSMAQCSRCGGPVLTMEARVSQLTEKVELLKEEKARHMTRKARWKQWLNTRKFVRKTKVVHYQTWEMWEPSTDEEEKENAAAITPSDDPAFQALEKDFISNQKLRQDRRRAALRCKERGNLLLSKGDLVGALNAYEEGLEHRRDMKELWTNKALVLLRLKKYGEVCQAVTTLLEYCDIFEDGYEKSAPICFKALCRRALAHRALYHWEDALSDLRQAVRLCPADRDAQRLLKETELQVKQFNDLFTILNEKEQKRVKIDNPTAGCLQRLAFPSSASSTSASSGASPLSDCTCHAESPSSETECTAATEEAQSPSLEQTEEEGRGEKPAKEETERALSSAKDEGAKEAEGDQRERFTALKSKKRAVEKAAKTREENTQKLPEKDGIQRSGSEIAKIPFSPGSGYVSPPLWSSVTPSSSLHRMRQNEPAGSGVFQECEGETVASSPSASLFYSSSVAQLSSVSSSSSLPDNAPSGPVEDSRSSLCRLDERVGQALRENRTFSSVSDHLVLEALQALQKFPAARLWFWCYPLCLSPAEHAEKERKKQDAHRQAGETSASSECTGERDDTREEGKKPSGTAGASSEKHRHPREEKKAQNAKKETCGAPIEQMTPKDLATQDICMAASRMRRLKREEAEHSEAPRNCDNDDEGHRRRSEKAFSIRRLETLTTCCNALRCLHCVCSFAAAPEESSSPTSQDVCEDESAGTTSTACVSSASEPDLSLSETCDSCAAALLALLPDILAAEKCLPSFRKVTDKDGDRGLSKSYSGKTRGTARCRGTEELPAEEEETKLREMKALLLGLLYFFSLQAPSRRKLVEHLQRRKEVHSFLLHLLSLMCLSRQGKGSSLALSPPLPLPPLQCALQNRTDAGALLCNLLLERSVQVALSGRQSTVRGETTLKTRKATTGERTGEKKKDDERQEGAGKESSENEILRALWPVVQSRVNALKRRCDLFAKLNQAVAGAQMDDDEKEEKQDGKEGMRALWKELALLLEATKQGDRCQQGATRLSVGPALERILATAKTGTAEETAKEREERESSVELFDLFHEQEETFLGKFLRLDTEADTEREDPTATAVQQCLSILTNLARCASLRLLILKNLRHALLQLATLMSTNSWATCPRPGSSPAAVSRSLLSKLRGIDTRWPGRFYVGRLPTAAYLGLLVNLTAASSADARTKEERELATRQSELLRDERLVRFLVPCLSVEQEEGSRRIKRIREEAKLVSSRSFTLARRVVVAISSSEGNQTVNTDRLDALALPPRLSTSPANAAFVSSLSPSLPSSVSAREVTRALLPSLSFVLRRWRAKGVENGESGGNRARKDTGEIDERTSAAVQLLCTLAQRTPFLITAARDEALLRREEKAKENTKETTDGDVGTYEKYAVEADTCRGGEERAKKQGGRKEQNGRSRTENETQRYEKKEEKQVEKADKQADTREDGKKTGDAQKPHDSFRLTDLLQCVCDILKTVTPHGYAKKAEEMKTPTALVRGNLLLFLGMAAKAQLAAISRSIRKEGEQKYKNKASCERVETAEKASSLVRNACPTEGDTEDDNERKERTEDGEEEEGSDRILKEMDLSGGILCCIEALRKDLGGSQRNAAVTLATLAQVAKYKPAIVALKGMESLMQIGGPLLLKQS
ncbi:conserved hypothetical protein [Neospora caninum Liverpool]|uniref:Tetratricopeptide repeat-containing protein n=1 Tax=Neospora caninum (strain Liverpool) TaxID=572307 RepID=F0VRT8_NEOCL|nr:conserved hypothetical protein [Neospora caninum Liverpool]CBZ56436.1 conserved hypothetical protein [Neospora caninum Liverpool]CEL71195.1 TPA: tetratricopeptide repeat-containing protein [Neospora caninum Liverpool]|eukprot:XP_003886461.1 conserved hypothetical protein [Neospora caninum Liverpool]